MLKYKHGNNIHENSRTNEAHEFVLNLSQRLDLQNLSKHVTLQNSSIYYTQKNITQLYENNKLKIIALTWNDEFESPNGSYSVQIFKIISNISLKT